jgi:hypothetical protein
MIGQNDVSPLTANSSTATVQNLLYLILVFARGGSEQFLPGSLQLPADTHVSVI